MKTAALLLYTQLEHDKVILQEQDHLVQVFGLFIYSVVFQAALGFLSSRAVPIAVFDKRVLLRTVECQCHAKDRLKYNQTVTEKFEQCCKVTDITVMVVIFTVYVNNEIIQMEYLLKRDHVCTQMKLGLVQSPPYNIDTVYEYFMDWSF